MSDSEQKPHQDTNNPGWTYEEVHKAVAERLKMLKNSYEIDDPPVARNLAQYTYALTLLAYKKGKEGDTSHTSLDVLPKK